MRRSAAVGEREPERGLVPAADGDRVRAEAPQLAQRRARLSTSQRAPRRSCGAAQHAVVEAPLVAVQLVEAAARVALGEEEHAQVDALGQRVEERDPVRRRDLGEEREPQRFTNDATSRRGTHGRRRSPGSRRSARSRWRRDAPWSPSTAHERASISSKFRRARSRSGHVAPLVEQAQVLLGRLDLAHRQLVGRHLALDGGGRAPSAALRGRRSRGRARAGGRGRSRRAGAPGRRAPTSRTAATRAVSADEKQRQSNA